MRQTSFRCLTCRAIISNTSLGTKHRNHCPLCLWSKHLDKNTPGDRASLCGARMKPIGLTYKRNGELMIVHECLGCHAISTNRIAGDDIPYVVMNVLEDSEDTCSETIIQLSHRGIQLLDKDDTKDVSVCLYGCRE